MRVSLVSGNQSSDIWPRQLGSRGSIARDLTIEVNAADGGSNVELL